MGKVPSRRGPVSTSVQKWGQQGLTNSTLCMHRARPPSRSPRVPRLPARGCHRIFQTPKVKGLNAVTSPIWRRGMVDAADTWGLRVHIWLTKLTDYPVYQCQVTPASLYSRLFPPQSGSIHCCRANAHATSATHSTTSTSSSASAGHEGTTSACTRQTSGEEEGCTEEEAGRENV